MVYRGLEHSLKNTWDGYSIAEALSGMVIPFLDAPCVAQYY